ncbi:uncharacterized protein LOC132751118 isoform X2 [Ruditapes philippinarum]|uniref:uncharacterized protein LOC132751118 isoform X2 n=1 Tax=Ruditapes philippinarum TaxID=129788 RepID=UPI00295B9106|nr:uncharacterized protein LOC132751118 isoform X2 [Ruditapes philippinarum]
MMNCSHSPEDIKCLKLGLVFVVAVMSVICAIGIIWICCILKQRLGDFKCTNQKPSHQADTLQEQQGTRNEGADVNEGTDNPEGQSKTHYKRIKKPLVYVLLKDDRLKECIEKIFKGMDLIPKYFHSDNEPTFDENENYKFDDESTTIIVVRHGSIRIDSDIGGCCNHISDSDIKRTVVVIINEYGSNKKGEHGDIIKPNSYVIDNIQDLKNVVVLNYKCCMKKTKCKHCKYALDELEQHARSQNYK